VGTMKLGSVLLVACVCCTALASDEDRSKQMDVKHSGSGHTGAPSAPFHPFPSLAGALDGPRSAFFGVTPDRKPRDPNTRYQAGGVSGAEEPHTFHLTFEVTNNRILCSTTSTGLLQNPCIFSRLVPAERRGRHFLGEELLGGSPWSFLLRRGDGMPESLHLTHRASVELLGTLFPLFTYEHEGLRTRLLLFAPEVREPEPIAPRAILAIVQVHNLEDAAVDAALLIPHIRDLSDADLASAAAAPSESPHPRFTEHAVPIRPGYEAVTCLGDAAWRPGFPEISFALQPGEDAIFSFAFMLGENPEELRQTGELLRRRTALDWLNETWRSQVYRYGRLSIPDDPYYAESYIRLVEEGRSAILCSSDGLYFGGGPGGYSDVGMTLFQPEFVAEATARSLSGYRPRRPDQSRPSRLTHSLVGALGPLPLAGVYYRMTGDRRFFREHPEVLDFAREQLADILETREGQPFLFPSKMLWDGPSRGDYHTGSNLMAWLAFHGLARVARDACDEPELADEWSAVADKVKRDILNHCVGEGSLGPRFFEGANADGAFVPGHDGEEAFTTLMPFFGFCEADDPAYINHAKLALSPENPLYAPAVDGIWWVDANWTDATRPVGEGMPWSGTTMPGQMAMLAGITDERELHQRLEQLRGLTDLDGSIWWWPYAYPCTDPQLVRRRDSGCDVSKSGYVAAIYLCMFVNNILGLRVDVPAHQVSLRPFCPWPEFTWESCRLGRSAFDFAYEHRDGRMVGRITNHNDSIFQGMIELVLPDGAAAGVCEVNGVAADEIKHTERYRRPAVRATAAVPPGRVLQLQVECADR